MGENFRTPAKYLVSPADLNDVQKLTATLFHQVCRTGWDQAGFSLLRLGSDWGSRPQRQLMLDILDELSALCEARPGGKPLQALSMSRFNQQATTRPHRDGGPAESLLLLGYEPTLVESRLSLADYSKCARDMGLSPAEFLDRHNPMFSGSTDLLAEYITHLVEFDPSQFQILLINNSCADFDEQTPHWQGVLHQATISQPREDAVRVVNSIQLTPMTSAEISPITADERKRFLTDDALGRQYGRQSA